MGKSPQEQAFEDAMIADIKAGKLNPMQQKAMDFITKDWQPQTAFTAHNIAIAALGMLQKAGLVEHEYQPVHYKQGFNPNLPMKDQPPEGTDATAPFWRLKQ